MITTRIPKRALVALAAMLAASAAQAAPSVTLAPASRLVLHGKSTLHEYHSVATRMELRVELGDVPSSTDTLIERLSRTGAVKTIVLTIPVQAMHSDRDGLDKNMQKALKASENPNIVFRMSAPPPPSSWAADGSNVTVNGVLEIAGQARPIEVPLRISSGADGMVLEGRKALRMTDFGIKPPAMMLGTLKTADAIDIEFRLVLGVAGF